MGDVFLAFSLVVLVLVVIYIHKIEKERRLNSGRDIINHRQYRDNPKSFRNIQNTDSTARKFWEPNSQAKEENGWIWGRKKPQSPTKKLQFEGNEFYKPNEALNKNYDMFSPVMPNRSIPNNNNNNNPFSLFSEDVKKNYDHVFINNLNHNNPYQNKTNITLNNFKPGGSIFTNSVTNNIQPQTNSINNYQNTYPTNFKVIKAEEFIKNTLDVSPLNKSKEDIISLDDVNPSLTKYINRNEPLKTVKYSEVRETGVKIEEEKKTNPNIFEELVPKKLNFNDKKVVEKNEDNKVFHESFNSFAKQENVVNDKSDKPNLQKLINKIQSETIINPNYANRKKSI